MTRRFVSAKRLIRYFSNSSKLVEHRAQSLFYCVKSYCNRINNKSQSLVYCVKSRPCEILKPYCIVFAHQGNLACRFMLMINCFITVKIIRTVGDKVCFVLRPPRYYGPIFCPCQWPHSEIPVCIIFVNFIPFMRSRTSHAHLSNVTTV